MSTSLVFLVVLGIWAAYLTQQWMRRREHLVTARSVDAFNEALRVLERRPQATPAPAASTPPRPRSYQVSPLRTQPGVVVTNGRTGSTAAPRPAPAARRTAASVRLRAAGLAALVLALLVAVLLAGLGHASWLLPVLALAAVGADVAYLRATAGTHHGAAPAPVARPVEPSVEHLAPAPRVDEQQTAEAEPVVEPEPEPETTVAPEPVTVPRPAAARSAAPFDISAFDEPAPAPVVPAPPAPGTWRPTPVPAPLYTRKQAVVRVPAPAPAAPADPESDRVLTPVDIEDEVLELESPFRQVVNG